MTIIVTDNKASKNFKQGDLVTGKGDKLKLCIVTDDTNGSATFNGLILKGNNPCGAVCLCLSCCEWQLFSGTITLTQ